MLTHTRTTETKITVSSADLLLVVWLRHLANCFHFQMAQITCEGMQRSSNGIFNYVVKFSSFPYQNVGKRQECYPCFTLLVCTGSETVKTNIYIITG